MVKKVLIFFLITVSEVNIYTQEWAYVQYSLASLPVSQRVVKQTLDDYRHINRDTTSIRNQFMSNYMQYDRQKLLDLNFKVIDILNRIDALKKTINTLSLRVHTLELQKAIKADYTIRSLRAATKQLLGALSDEVKNRLITAEKPYNSWGYLQDLKAKLT